MSLIDHFDNILRTCPPEIASLELDFASGNIRFFSVSPTGQQVLQRIETPDRSLLYCKHDFCMPSSERCKPSQDHPTSPRAFPPKNRNPIKRQVTKTTARSFNASVVYPQDTPFHSFLTDLFATENLSQEPISNLSPMMNESAQIDKDRIHKAPKDPKRHNESTAPIVNSLDVSATHPEDPSFPLALIDPPHTADYLLSDPEDDNIQLYFLDNDAPDSEDDIDDILQLYSSENDAPENSEDDIDDILQLYSSDNDTPDGSHPPNDDARIANNEAQPPPAELTLYHQRGSSTFAQSLHQDNVQDDVLNANFSDLMGEIDDLLHLYSPTYKTPPESTSIHGRRVPIAIANYDKFPTTENDFNNVLGRSRSRENTYEPDDASDETERFNDGISGTYDSGDGSTVSSLVLPVPARILPPNYHSLHSDDDEYECTNEFGIQLSLPPPPCTEIDPNVRQMTPSLHHDNKNAPERRLIASDDARRLTNRPASYSIRIDELDRHLEVQAPSSPSNEWNDDNYDPNPQLQYSSPPGQNLDFSSRYMAPLPHRHKNDAQDLSNRLFIANDDPQHLTHRSAPSNVRINGPSRCLEPQAPPSPWNEQNDRTNNLNVQLLYPSPTHQDIESSSRHTTSPFHCDKNDISGFSGPLSDTNDTTHHLRNRPTRHYTQPEAPDRHPGPLKLSSPWNEQHNGTRRPNVHQKTGSSPLHEDFCAKVRQMTRPLQRDENDALCLSKRQPTTTNIQTHKFRPLNDTQDDHGTSSKHPIETSDDNNDGCSGFCDGGEGFVVSSSPPFITHSLSTTHPKHAVHCQRHIDYSPSPFPPPGLAPLPVHSKSSPASNNAKTLKAHSLTDFPTSTLPSTINIASPTRSNETPHPKITSRHVVSSETRLPSKDPITTLLDSCESIHIPNSNSFFCPSQVSASPMTSLLQLNEAFPVPPPPYTKDKPNEVPTMAKPLHPFASRLLPAKVVSFLDRVLDAETLKHLDRTVFNYLDAQAHDRLSLFNPP